MPYFRCISVFGSHIVDICLILDVFPFLVPTLLTYGLFYMYFRFWFPQCAPVLVLVDLFRFLILTDSRYKCIDHLQ